MEKEGPEEDEEVEERSTKGERRRRTDLVVEWRRCELGSWRGG